MEKGGRCGLLLQVNKMRELPENPSIVATHSDAKEVYIWHFDRQPNRAADKVCHDDSWYKLILTLLGGGGGE